MSEYPPHSTALLLKTSIDRYLYLPVSCGGSFWPGPTITSHHLAVVKRAATHLNGQYGGNR